MTAQFPYKNSLCAVPLEKMRCLLAIIGGTPRLFLPIMAVMLNFFACLIQ